MKRLNNTLYELIDQYTGENVTYTKTTTHFDGSAMSDGKCDGVIYRKSGTEYFKLNFTGKLSVKRFGIAADGTDQTAKINAALALPFVKSIVFDSYENSDFTITGTVNVTSGKHIHFENNNKVIGSGTWSGGTVHCAEKNQCFGTALTVSNLENTKVSVRWFGAVPDDTTDNRPMFMKAIHAPKVTNGVPPKIIVPSCDSSSGPYGNIPYYSSDLIDVDRTCKIEGEHMDSTVIRFEGGKIGIRLNAPSIQLKDLTVIGWPAFQSAGYNSSTAHGVQINGNGCLIENVSANFFDGDGFHLSNEDGKNSNSVRFSHCNANVNGRHGFYTQGGDANACTFIHCSGIGNARWNFYEAGFLGNTHIGHHSATAGTLHSGQKSFLTHNGVNYVCIFNNTNKEPGVASDWADYWEVTSLTATFQLTSWDATTNYFTTGAYFTASDNGNNRSIFLGCYAEPDQYITDGAACSIIIGGSLGLFSSRKRGTLENRFGTLLSPSIGSAGSTASYWFDTTNPNYHGLYMSTVGAGASKTMEVGLGWTRFRWANIDTGAYIIDHDFSAADLGRTVTPRETAFLSAATGMYFRNVNDGKFRLVGTASEAPTAGEWATGDLLINNGTTHPEAIFFKCTGGGVTGSTWTTINNATATPTPTLQEVLNAGSVLGEQNNSIQVNENNSLHIGHYNSFGAGIDINKDGNNHIHFEVEGNPNVYEFAAGEIRYWNSSNDYKATLSVNNITDHRTYQFPDGSGTLALKSDLVWVKSGSNITYTAGAVGIGTSTPSNAPLTLRASAAQPYGFTMQNRNNTQAWSFGTDANYIDDGDFYIINNNANSIPFLIKTSTGAVQLTSLAGSGARMVVADTNGLLSTQAIPSGGSGTSSKFGLSGEDDIASGNRLFDANNNDFKIDNIFDFEITATHGRINVNNDAQFDFFIDSVNSMTLRSDFVEVKTELQVTGQILGLNGLVLQSTSTYNGKIVPVNLTGARTYTLPDKDGTFAMLSDITSGGGSTSTLDQVLTAGNTTTQHFTFLDSNDSHTLELWNEDDGDGRILFKNNTGDTSIELRGQEGGIKANTYKIYDGANAVYSTITGVDSGIQINEGWAGQQVFSVAPDHLAFGYTDKYVNIVNNTLTQNRTYEMPDANGTLALTSDLTSKVGNDTDTYSSTPVVQKIITLSQTEYDAISTKDVNTLYIII